MTKRDVCAIGLVFVFVAIVLVATGVLMKFYYEQQTWQLVEKGAKLTMDSEGFNAWNMSGEERKETFHVFHVTNPEEVVRFGHKVTVEEKGPYVYRVREKKTDIMLDEWNNTLSYSSTKSYTFDSVSSGGGRSEADVLTVINIPILSLVSKLRLNRNKDAVRELAEANETLFKNVSVADLVWGIADETLDRINKKFKLFNDTTIGILHQTGVRSHTRDMGQYEVSTGTNDLSSVWNIKQWNNQTKLNYWNSVSSNAIKGTSGYAWHPFLSSSSDRLDAFDPEWCRSVYMTYEGHSSVGRLSTGRHVLPSSVLDSSRPENQGFCEETPEGESCLASGLINITSCSTERIPWILSQPCFYQADRRFAEAIRNLPPANKNRHETSLDIEMLIGEVIESRSRRQFNMFVRNDSDIFNETSNFGTPIMIPVAWVEEEYSMAETEKLRLQVLAFRRHSNERTTYGVIGFGLFLIVIAIIVLIVGLVRTTSSQGRSEWQPIPSHID